MGSSSKIDVEKLKQSLDGPHQLGFRKKLSDYIEKDPVFRKPVGRVPLEEARRIALIRNRKRLADLGGGISDGDHTLELIRRLREDTSLQEAEELYVFMNYSFTFGLYDWSSHIGFQLAWVLPWSIIKVLGTEVHANLLNKIITGDFVCCLMMTELSHGTNVREIRTRATFDTATQEFIFNSPDLASVKCWIGNLAGPATFGILFAQLYIDNQKRGMFPFLVQVRDMETHKLLPGITVGDMGEKVGMHSIANGWALMNNFRQPRSALLNRFVDISPEGELLSLVPAAGDNFSTLLLGTFGDGRVGLSALGVGGMIIATTIATRYSFARKQFPIVNPVNKDEPELPIMEFQLQQCRLIPHVAASHVWYYYLKCLNIDYIMFRHLLIAGEITLAESDLIKEVHALSCASKALSGWLGIQAIQEAREACGGHGYLHAARLGQLREDVDVNLTWEGDNNVLVLQTGAFLLGIFKKGQRESPLHSIDYIGQFDYSRFDTNTSATLPAFASKFTVKNIISDSEDRGFLVEVMRYVTCFRLWKFAKKFDALVKSGLSKDDARLQSQAFYAKEVALDYIETHVMTCFYNYVYDRADKIRYRVLRLRSQEYANVLQRLFALYACNVIQKRLSEAYESGLATPGWTSVCHEAIIELCATIKPDCLPLIDAVAPTDFIINSVLAHSDTNVMYDKVFESLLESSSHMIDTTAIKFPSKL